MDMLRGLVGYLLGENLEREREFLDLEEKLSDNDFTVDRNCE